MHIIIRFAPFSEILAMPPEEVQIMMVPIQFITSPTSFQNVQSFNIKYIEHVNTLILIHQIVAALHDH